MKWLRTLPRSVRLEAIGFGSILALAALNEYLDLPNILFGEDATPLRHHEFLMESASVCVVAMMIMSLTWFADRRLRRLDSLLVMCAWCQRVKITDRWTSLEAFLKESGPIRTSLGLCPTCYARESTRTPDGDHG